jgi:hypothetical protein
VGFFFVAMYAIAIFVVASLLGILPGLLVRLALPGRADVLAVPAVLLATAWWIWAGWLGARHGTSRLEVVFYTAVAGIGFTRGWLWGMRLARRRRIRPGAGSPRRSTPGRTRPSRNRTA